MSNKKEEILKNIHEAERPETLSNFWYTIHTEGDEARELNVDIIDRQQLAQ